MACSALGSGQSGSLAFGIRHRSNDTSGRRRHVWVDSIGGYRHPGLVLAWRRCTVGDGRWDARVAVVRGVSVLIEWLPAARLHPIADDRWATGGPTAHGDEER